MSHNSALSYRAFVTEAWEGRSHLILSDGLELGPRLFASG